MLMRWHRRRQKLVTPRTVLHESDYLLFWLEECLVQRKRFVPGWLMPRIVRVVDEADGELAAELKRERRPGPVMDVLYQAQELLMERSVRWREPAPIIPLFR